MAEYLSEIYVKSIETHARAFLTLNILSKSTVLKDLCPFDENPVPLETLVCTYLAAIFN